MFILHSFGKPKSYKTRNPCTGLIILAELPIDPFILVASPKSLCLFCIHVGFFMMENTNEYFWPRNMWKADDANALPKCMAEKMASVLLPLPEFGA